VVPALGGSTCLQLTTIVPGLRSPVDATLALDVVSLRAPRPRLFLSRWRPRVSDQHHTADPCNGANQREANATRPILMENANASKHAYDTGAMNHKGAAWAV
jgi:hypothetical protein